MPATPNLLYFVVHDLGRHLGCYGRPVSSPRIDAFAAEAVRFDQAFCSSPACTPSRICAMTGQYAHVTGGVGLAHMGWPLGPEVRTVVDHLREGGYQTIHAGMQHERHPRENRYETDLETHWACHTTRRAVDDALAYLARRDRSRPFYLNLGSQEPHPSTWHRTDSHYGGALPPDQVYVPPHLPDRPGVRAALGRFQASLRYMDEHFGRLLEGLARLGHDEDTVVVFTTDHGINGWRAKGTLYDTGTEIALLVRLPDRRGAGTSVAHLLPNLDFLPTLLDWAGLEPPAVLPGRSFAPLLQGKPYHPHREIFTERNFHGEYRHRGERPAIPVSEYVDRYDPIRAVRTTRHHYLRNFDPALRSRPWLPAEVPVTAQETGPEWSLAAPPSGQARPAEELYDVVLDPLETVNLAARPEFRACREDLSARLERWMRETGDFVLRDEVPTRPVPRGWGAWDDLPGDEEEARRQGRIPAVP